jgi:hypothetical protein
VNRSGCFPNRGALINALASAGARRVEAEAALSRCPDRPERIAERLVLQARAVTRRAEEEAARLALDRWELAAE